MIMARPLKIFMRGKSITTLQEVLRRMGYPIHDQKGLFGTDTRDAVKSFQKQQGLKPTGLVDDELMQLMQRGHAAVAPAEKEVVAKQEVQSVNQHQLDCLIRLLIQKEVLAEGELEAEMKKVIPTSL